MLIGILTECEQRVTQWSREMRRGDVMVTPPGCEHDASYCGCTSFFGIGLPLAEIHDFFKGESQLQDIASWQKRIVSPDSGSREYVLTRLNELMFNLQNRNVTLTKNAANFWKRSVIDALTASIVQTSSSHFFLRSPMNIVRKVEDYLEGSDVQLVHISQLCNALNVSRRTLHRAFHDAIGMGPVAFLQHRRLCSIRSALRESDPATTTIAEIALQHGFVNLGRFSGYYQSLFGEYPSQTFTKGSVRGDLGSSLN